MMTIAATIVKTYLASSQNSFGRSFDLSLSHLLNLWGDNDAEGF